MYALICTIRNNMKHIQHIQTYAKICKKYAKVCKSMQRYAKVCKVSKSMKKYAKHTQLMYFVLIFRIKPISNLKIIFFWISQLKMVDINWDDLAC